MEWLGAVDLTLPLPTTRYPPQASRPPRGAHPPPRSYTEGRPPSGDQPRIASSHPQSSATGLRGSGLRGIRPEPVKDSGVYV
ncbi:hypothetical protein NDU88_001360 [Pleurodeles waltl]|uniref:Uncharacterized protein n=1 Tax=Pleurodeles waltl TaxID=8319 RepID=A0AAV7SAQ8_PLEWA|nr:hypothetical protein NDU88_001360 [Pleurodeles waltl]